MSRRPAVWYAAQRYWSFRRVAADYTRLLSRSWRFVTSPERADVSILHGEPRFILPAFERHPALARSRTLAITAWETDRLPAHLGEGMRRLGVVMVPSQHSAAAFSAVHPRVRIVPHVVGGPRTCRPREREQVREWLRGTSSELVFLTITKSLDPRKNLAGLIAAFETAAIPGAVLLVVSRHPPLRSAPGVIHVGGGFPRSLLNALYRRADVVVSAHHGEGWGLTLSDAMHHGRLVVATGHSGNLMFMDEGTSILVPPSVGPVRAADVVPSIYERGMRWANPRVDQIAAALRRASDEVRDGTAAARVRRASLHIRRFRASAVAPSLHTCMQEALATACAEI